jgi:hypothetical protein
VAVAVAVERMGGGNKQVRVYPLLTLPLPYCHCRIATAMLPLPLPYCHCHVATATAMLPLPR